MGHSTCLVEIHFVPPACAGAGGRYAASSLPRFAPIGKAIGLSRDEQIPSRPDSPSSRAPMKYPGGHGRSFTAGSPCRILPRTGAARNVLRNKASDSRSLRFHGSSDTKAHHSSGSMKGRTTVIAAMSRSRPKADVAGRMKTPGLKGERCKSGGTSRISVPACANRPNHQSDRSSSPARRTLSVATPLSSWGYSGRRIRYAPRLTLSGPVCSMAAASVSSCRRVDPCQSVSDFTVQPAPLPAPAT